MTETTKSTYADLIAKIASAPLSSVLPMAISLARDLGDKDLEKWARLELNGYYNTNPALTEDVTVPPYRTVSGQHVDAYGRPLIIPDSRLAFINEYRLRFSVPELEAMEKKSGLITITDPHSIEILREQLKVDTRGYSFSSVMISGILSAVRTSLSDQLYALRSKVDQETPTPHTSTYSSLLDTQGLHPRVREAAASLFADGYYRQAILDTYIALIQAVRAKAGRYDIDGAPLMQTVFSPKRPVLVISDDPDEQMGFMWMFSGAVMGVRNPKAHDLLPHTDRQSALEWLAFASVLFRLLDSTKPPSDQTAE